MTAQEKWDKFEKAIPTYPKNFRTGQAVWAVAFDIDSVTVIKLTGTEFDCYYDNSRIQAFKTRIFELWNENEAKCVQHALTGE